MKEMDLKLTMQNILKKINNFNQNRWFIFSLLTTTSGIWFSFILTFFGETLHLIIVDENNKRSFTFLGILLTVITIVWSLISMIAQRYCEYHNRKIEITEEDLGETETLYQTLNNSSFNILEEQIFEKTSYIEQCHKDPSFLSNQQYKPCEILKLTSAEMIRSLSKLLSFNRYNIKEKDLHIDVFYSFPQFEKDKWHHADSNRQRRGLNFQNLQDKDSTFYEAINSVEGFAFYNDKNEAYINHHYIKDNADIIRKGKIEGSIGCFCYTVEKDNVYIKFVITLASYGKRFAKKENEVENILQNLRTVVFPEYELLIKNALCDIYIKKLIEKNAP